MARLLLFSFTACIAASASAQTDQRIPWQHVSLELYRAAVSDDADRVRMEFCVQPKEGFHEGTISVGYPRYRTPWGRWVDCPIAGIDRYRPLYASADTGPACFSVLVAPDAAAVELSLGHRTLEVPVAGWLERRAAQREPTTHIDDPWQPEPAAEPRIVLADERRLEGATLPVPRDHIVGVHLRVRNAGEGDARGLVAWIEPGAGVFAAKDGATRIDLGDLAPGAVSEFVYRCYADRSAIALRFQVTFQHADGGTGATGSVVSFPLEQAGPPPRLASDVDGDVAASLSARPDALAVVLGVGDYAKAPEATFAADDAKTAARYFQSLLGIPASRIELLLDGEVTLGQMQRIFGSEGWLARRVSPDSEIFVFFAGHGMAELETFSPYLLPADADPDYLRQTALSLDRMIEMIASLGARRTTLFLDACFSGVSREGAALLDDGRPLLIEQTRRVPTGLSIFSAGSGSQVVSAIEEKGHGLFSYYLFKGIAGDADRDHDRRVLASELKSYLEDAVPRAAQSLDREQTPGIAVADPEEVLVLLP